MKDIDFAFAFPFSKKAKEIIKEKMININDEVVDKGVERIISDLKGRKEEVVIDDKEKFMSIISFAAARLILSGFRNRYVINKFAVQESKRSASFINSMEKEDIKRLTEELKFKVEERNGFFLVPVPDYLQSSPKSMPYKLIYREIKGGKVKITKAEFYRLLEERIKKRMMKIPFLREIPSSVAKGIERLKKEMPKEEKTARLVEKRGGFPPCIKELIKRVKAHENIPHQGRWFLAVYLVAVGYKLGEILSLFSNLPDYNEKISKYQIEHIIKRKYSVPSCATAKSYGVCVAECGIKNPLSWRKKK